MMPGEGYEAESGLVYRAGTLPLLCCFVSLLNSKFKSQLLTDGTEQDRVTVEKNLVISGGFQNFTCCNLN